MTLKVKNKGELFIPIIIIIISIYLYIETFSFKFASYQEVGPQIWPRGILILLILFSSIKIVEILIFGEAGQEKSKLKLKNILSMIITLFLYIFSMQYIGYITSTLIFTFSAMLLFGNRSILQLIIIPILIVSFTYLILTHLMYVPLPKGIGIFRDISLFF
jgi:putative tricarboxylic transport membrane protein